MWRVSSARHQCGSEHSRGGTSPSCRRNPRPFRAMHGSRRLGAGRASRSVDRPTALRHVLERGVMMTAERKRKRTSPREVNLQWLSRELDDALRRGGAIAEIKEMRPREFVDLMTSSSFEIGRVFKRGLRDALYDLRRDASKKRSRARRGTDT
jgi:hypothetical protein